MASWTSTAGSERKGNKSWQMIYLAMGMPAAGLRCLRAMQLLTHAALTLPINGGNTPDLALLWAANNDASANSNTCFTTYRHTDVHTRTI